MDRSTKVVLTSLVEAVEALIESLDEAKCVGNTYWAKTKVQNARVVLEQLAKGDGRGDGR